MKSNSTSHTNSTLPYHYYSGTILFILFMALLNSGYLLYSHYLNYVDLSFSSFCALTKSINCDSVAQSSWSILFGLPIALWGIFAYLLYLALAIATLKNKNELHLYWYILLNLGLIYSFASVYFGYISATKIKAYCILCLSSYLLNFLLFFFSLIIIRRFGTQSFKHGTWAGFVQLLKSRPLITVIGFLSCTAALLIVFLPHYWEYRYPMESSSTETGYTAEGHPWIGAENPEIIIHEYTDYQCFQCGKMHLYLRRLISEYPGKIKLVHHHYPMDHEFNNVVVPDPFHIGSGKMALVAIQSIAVDKFWEVNDILYEFAQRKESFNITELGAIVDIPPQVLKAGLNNPTAHKILNNDIRHGMELRITGTPTFIIDNQSYTGTIPKQVLERIFTGKSEDLVGFE